MSTKLKPNSADTITKFDIQIPLACSLLTYENDWELWITPLALKVMMVVWYSLPGKLEAHISL